MIALKAQLGYNDVSLLDIREEELCNKKQILQFLNPEALGSNPMIDVTQSDTSYLTAFRLAF